MEQNQEKYIVVFLAGLDGLNVLDLVMEESELEWERFLEALNMEEENAQEQDGPLNVIHIDVNQEKFIVLYPDGEDGLNVLNHAMEVLDIEEEELLEDLLVVEENVQH